MKYEGCLILLPMTGTGNQTPDPLTFSLMPFTLTSLGMKSSYIFHYILTFYSPGFHAVMTGDVPGMVGKPFKDIVTWTGSLINALYDGAMKTASDDDHTSLETAKHIVKSTHSPGSSLLQLSTVWLRMQNQIHPSKH